MARLVRCSWCGDVIPSNAWRCQNCRRLQPHGNRMIAIIALCGMVLGGFAIAAVSLMLEQRAEAMRLANDPQHAAKRAAEERTHKIESQFSKRDGRHRAFTLMVQERLNDPDSFDHVRTRYRDCGDHIELLMIFRANNMFGAKVVGVATGGASIDGNKVWVRHIGPPDDRALRDW